MRRLKRLASMGLPREPFVRTVFDLVNEAMPNLENKIFLAHPLPRTEYMISSGPELDGLWDAAERYARASSQVRGAIEYQEAVNSPLILWTHEQFTHRHFYRSEGYNEMWRLIGVETFAVLMLREYGELMGSYPVWRGRDMKPFSHEDHRFLIEIAPYLATGLAASRVTGSVLCTSADQFVSSDQNFGTILLDSDRRIVGISDNARTILRQVGVFDKAAKSEGHCRITGALDRIARVLRGIFSNGWESVSSPASAVYHDASGVVVKLRGFLLRDDRGRRNFNVIVERGELRDLRRRRIAARYGLSASEIELLAALGADEGAQHTAQRIGITQATFRSYQRRLRDKLEFASIAELRDFAKPLMLA